MFGEHFYWASIRKLNVAFGNMFNNIRVQRTDSSGAVQKIVRVPIAYGPKRGYLQRLREEQVRQQDSGRASASIPNIAITLPRMSWEFTGFDYRPEDKMQQQGYIRRPKTGTDQYSKLWNPVPYNIGFDLNLYAKHLDDALQISEQILPYFGPDQNFTINEIPELGLKNDVQVKLVGFDPTMEYEGLMGDEQPIIWTFQFEARTLLFPGTSDSGVIKKVITNIASTNDVNDTTMNEGTIITQTVNPFEAEKTDPYVVDEVFTNIAGPELPVVVPPASPQTFEITSDDGTNYDISYTAYDETGQAYDVTYVLDEDGTQYDL
jgi:hypothetical protein